MILQIMKIQAATCNRTQKVLQYAAISDSKELELILHPMVLHHIHQKRFSLRVSRLMPLFIG